MLSNMGSTRFGNRAVSAFLVNHYLAPQRPKSAKFGDRLSARVVRSEIVLFSTCKRPGKRLDASTGSLKFSPNATSAGAVINISTGCAKTSFPSTVTATMRVSGQYVIPIVSGRGRGSAIS